MANLIGFEGASQLKLSWGEMRILNFAWGSHLDRAQYAIVLGSEPNSWQLAKLNDYGLTAAALKVYPADAGAELAADGGAPRLAEKLGSSVYGVLYEIDETQWAKLDEYERAWGFEPVNVQVELESGEQIEAQAHNLVHFGDFQAPSRQFLSTMERGYRELGYSEEIIEQAMRSMTMSE